MTKEIAVKFQSTHSRGVRQGTYIVVEYNDENFNPRTHGECDEEQEQAAAFFGISIHALTGSATIFSAFFCALITIFQSTHSRGVRLDEGGKQKSITINFNPRTHGECDQLVKCSNSTSHEFQSTHSRGVRRTNRAFIIIRFYYFNPRTHGECDVLLIRKCLLLIHISIHALTGSATKTICQSFHYTLISIHALTGSAT